MKHERIPHQNGRGEEMVGDFMISPANGLVVVTHLETRQTIHRAPNWKEALDFAMKRLNWTPHIQ